jgi:hypothetical protein
LAPKPARSTVLPALRGRGNTSSIMVRNAPSIMRHKGAPGTKF